MSFSIFPRVVYKTKSKISGPIEVKEQLGKYTLHVQDLIQSGGIIRGIWKKALRQVSTPSSTRGAQGKLSVSNCLVLGLGGGTVIQLIKAHWPEAKIVGVEIDSEIIKVGREFFGLDRIDNLKIINTDAIKWVNNYQGNKFDLILVDLYVSGNFPEKVASDEFLKKLKKLLSKDGKVIFNRLISPSEDLTGFEEKLKKHFPFLKTIETHTNLLFLARS